MSDNNGAYPTTLEQRVHALEDEREADRKHIGTLEDRWGQLYTATIQTQASARKASAASNEAHGEVASLRLHIDNFERAITAKLDELIGVVRELARLSGG